MNPRKATESTQEETQVDDRPLEEVLVDQETVNEFFSIDGMKLSTRSQPKKTLTKD